MSSHPLYFHRCLLYLFLFYIIKIHRCEQLNIYIIKSEDVTDIFLFIKELKELQHMSAVTLNPI